MKEWEYLKIETSREIKTGYIRNTLNDFNPEIDLVKYGEDGWELVSVVPLAAYRRAASGFTEQ